MAKKEIERQVYLHFFSLCCEYSIYPLCHGAVSPVSLSQLFVDFFLALVLTYLLLCNICKLVLLILFSLGKTTYFLSIVNLY